MSTKAKSEVRSLVNEISSYEFLVALAIWHDVLFAVTSLSKNLPADKKHLGVASQLLHGMVKFLDQFRIEGFTVATIAVREISETLGTEPKFQEVRQKVPKKEKKTVFYRIIDCTTQSLTKRFEQMALMTRCLDSCILSFEEQGDTS